jgi:integrase
MMRLLSLLNARLASAWGRTALYLSRAVEIIVFREYADRISALVPYFYTGVWRELQGHEAAGIGKLATHTFRHSYRMWIDAIGTPVGVQQRLMRHSDIRTTMNIYGDAASADMREAHGKIVQLACNGR